jgi:prepilin-type N-terminal cleavage/methylation domain-containing protein/prepilin-type processing-associated H-X9-DG protein
LKKDFKRGFTLIELLVVIAIIAILAAILFPVFARARENARRASCQSNLKQIALGLFMYNQDYDEKLPLFYFDLGGGGNYTDGISTAGADQGWAQVLQPYLKSTQIFQCPSETTVQYVDDATNKNAGYTDYWYNNQIDGLSDAAFDAPSVTVLFGDGVGHTPDFNTNGGCSVDPCVAADTGLATIDAGAHRHLTGANIAFADGHVKWEKGVSDSSSTLSGVYMGGYSTSNGKPTFDYKQ